MAIKEKEKREKPPTDTSGIKPPEGNGGGGFAAEMASTLATVSHNQVVAAVTEPDPVAPDHLSGVVTGKEFAPPKILAYGIDGIGKSTFASQAPNPIFIQTEKGLDQIGAPRFPVSTTYDDVLARLSQVATAKHSYQTVVIDGASGLEQLIYRQVAAQNGKQNIDLVGGGFDKGQKLAMAQWNEVVALLDQCSTRGMAVILLAHARSEKIGDPENPMAEQYAPALHRKTSGEMFRRWADCTLFMCRRMTVRKEGQGIMEKVIAVPIGADGGERIVRTAWTPASVAKNRYDMPLEIALPKTGSWDLIMGYISSFYSSNQKG